MGSSGTGLAEDDGHLTLGPSEELERVLDPLGDDGSGAPAERRRDGPLEAGMRLDARDDEVGARGLERARRRREALAALDRRVESLDPRAVDVEPALGIGCRRAGVALGHRGRVCVDASLCGGAIGARHDLVGGGDGCGRRGCGSLGLGQGLPAGVAARVEVRGSRAQLVRPAGRRLGLAAGGGRLTLRLGEAAARLHHRSHRGLGGRRRLGSLARVGRGETPRLERRALGGLESPVALASEPLGVLA